MVISEIQKNYLNKHLFYSYLNDKRKKDIKIKFLYIIKKPKKIITWFTTNPDIAEYASQCGFNVTCKSFKSRIIK